MCSHGLNIHLYKHFEAEEGEGMCFAVLENVGKSSRLGGGAAEYVPTSRACVWRQCT